MHSLLKPAFDFVIVMLMNAFSFAQGIFNLESNENFYEGSEEEKEIENRTWSQILVSNISSEV